MKLSATAKEAVADVQVEISQEEAAQAGSGAPGSRTRQDSRPEQPDVCQRSANLRPRDSRVRRLVLFGAAPRVQPHRRTPVPDSPRTTQVCAGHDQSSARRGPSDRVRGSRRRPVKSRPGGRSPPGEGGATDRRPPRELADARARPAAPGVRVWVWSSSFRACRTGRRVRAPLGSDAVAMRERPVAVDWWSVAVVRRRCLASKYVRGRREKLAPTSLRAPRARQPVSTCSPSSAARREEP